MKNRKKNQKLNSGTALIYQLITIISSFILPKLYLQYYGSEVNGLVASINNFLSFVSLMDLGIGAVIQYNLYKPLVEKNYKLVSEIYVSATNFFKKIVIVFIVYLIMLICIYPVGIKNFDYFFTASLIFILAMNLIAEYLFGVVNQYLLNADQKIYIPQLISSIIIVLNVLISIYFIGVGISFHILKIINTLIFMIKPMFLYLYVTKNYPIDRKVKLSKEPIKQKWNGLIQHISAFVTGSTDTIILTIFSSLQDVSVYYIYNLVVNGVKQLVMALMSGTEALFGHMIVNNEKEDLKNKFLDFEWIMNTVITFCFSCTGSLILNFVLIYTKNINDANYYQPMFSIIISLTVNLWCIRTIYYILVKAAGHYKETQLSSLIEMIINLLISLLLVNKYGLIGVILGTFISLLYRTIYLATYINNIIEYPFINFIKSIFVNIICFLLIYIFSKIGITEAESLIQWGANACKIALFTVILQLIINSIFYRKYIIKIYKKIKYVWR